MSNGEQHSEPVALARPEVQCRWCDDTGRYARAMNKNGVDYVPCSMCEAGRRESERRQREAVSEETITVSVSADSEGAS